MTVTVTPFLRNALLIDIAGSGATALLLVFASSLLAPLFGLPAALLLWAAAIMVPFLALLAFAARQRVASRRLITSIIALNAGWVAASVLLLVSNLVQPTLLGYAFVVAQALAVALFAELQFTGLRRATALATAH